MFKWLLDNSLANRLLVIIASLVPVSYTHLDVYKRQWLARIRHLGWCRCGRPGGAPDPGASTTRRPQYPTRRCRMNSRMVLTALSLAFLLTTPLAQAGDGHDPVSYTHLDVYKRQANKESPSMPGSMESRMMAA